MKPVEVVSGFYADNEHPLGFVGAVEKWMHPDCEFWTNGDKWNTGRDAFVAQFDWYNCVYKRPYAHITIKQLEEVGNKVFIEWSEECYNKETGNTYTGNLFGIYTVEGDQITCRSDYYDLSHYALSKATYQPSYEEIQAYRASLGYAPHSEKKEGGIVTEV